MISTIPYGRQDIQQEDIQAVVDVLKSDFLTQGPKVKEFEEAFAEYVGSKYAVTVTNGTAALHLAAMALSVGPKSKVITTPITFVASANCVLYCGGNVDFADIDPKSFCIDLNRVEDLLKKKPGSYSGIIPVDFAGYPINMEELSGLAKKHNLWIIEDACHAPGATFKDSKGKIHSSGNGAFSDISVYSFHPVKHIACGEGGMLTTNSEVLYKKLMLLRTHGITKQPSEFVNQDGPWYYEMQELGFNYRISDILCALGTSQLKRANISLGRRKEIAQRYDAELKGLSLTLPHVPEGHSHAYHLYVIQTEQRAELYNHLKKNNIYPQVHYVPVHKQPYYVNKYGQQSFPVSEKFYESCLSLPMYHSLSADDQTTVIEAIKSFYQ